MKKEMASNKDKYVVEMTDVKAEIASIKEKVKGNHEDLGWS